jgi:hypothetical protein
MQGVLIGLAGKARTGKDTAATYFEQAAGLEPMSFAAPIKQVICDLFNLDGRHTNGDLKETLIPGIGKSPRQLFQTLGTEWGRDCVHPDVWLHVAGVWLSKLRAEYTSQGARFAGAVFSDVRFENEAQWIRNQGGVVIHIRRDLAPVVSEHISEQGVLFEAGDLKVSNHGTLDEFYVKLGATLKEIEATA